MIRSRAVVIGAGHWHVPLYADALLRRHELVGVQDEVPDRAAHLAGLAGLKPSADRQAVLRQPGVELAYVFGAHDLMLKTCLELVELGIPFVVEKPAGTGLGQLNELVGAVRRAGVPTAVPLVQRNGPIETWLRQAGEACYLRASFVAGPPARYQANGCPWMLQPARSGGGCLANLGPHFVDMFLRAIGGSEISIQASTSSALHRGEVEDHATLVLRTAEGREGVIEIGYAFPGSPLKRSSSYTLAGADGYAEIAGTGEAHFTDVEGRTTTSRVMTDSDPLYGRFVDAVADSLTDGFSGLASLEDAYPSLAVIWKAYERAVAEPWRGSDVQTIY